MPHRKPKTQVIRPLVMRGDGRRLRRVLERFDEVQIAAELDNLAASDAVLVLQNLPLARRSEVLGAMRYEAAAEVIARFAPEEAARLVENLESDDAADILGRLEQERLNEILSRLDAHDASMVTQLLEYDEFSAGGIMSPVIVQCRENVTVAQVIDQIQHAEELPDQSFDVYVVDEEGRLVGVTSLRELVTSKPNQTIRDIMDGDPMLVTAGTDQEDVAELASRYDRIAIPVVDDHRRLLGVVEIDDIVDVLREEATEDILKMAGAGEMLVDTRSFAASFRARWRWLLAAAAGGTLAALTLSGFDHAIAAVPALAFFMPVVAGMGGNVGTQSSTIVVRGLAVGFIEANKIGRLLVREVGLGACAGVLYGVLIALVAPWFVGPSLQAVRLGLVISIGLAGSMTIAAAVGTSVPLILDRMRIDPAVATGPFVTTSVDVLGLLFYFFLAHALLGVS